MRHKLQAHCPRQCQQTSHHGLPESQVFHRVPIQPRDAREASDVFYNQGQGDVLLNYENEVFMTNQSYSATGQHGKVMPYVVPQHNVRVRSC